MCTHVCTITYCLRGTERVQLRLPLCGVCGACRWERNKSNIDCRAALPPAGDPQTCRPGSKCFSPPKLAWEEQEQPSYTPSTGTAYDLMTVLGTDAHIHMHTHPRSCVRVHVGAEIHSQSFPDWYHISHTLAPVKHTLGRENHTDINPLSSSSDVEHTHSLSKDHSPQVSLFTSHTTPQGYLPKLRI